MTKNILKMSSNVALKHVSFSSTSVCISLWMKDLFYVSTSLLIWRVKTRFPKKWALQDKTRIQKYFVWHQIVFKHWKALTGAGTAVTSPEASLSSISVSEFLNLFWQSRSQTGSQGFWLPSPLLPDDKNVIFMPRSYVPAHLCLQTSMPVEVTCCGRNLVIVLSLILY